jgi:hypothetical protein
LRFWLESVGSFARASFPGLSMLSHLELGAATAMMGDEASDPTSESPDLTGIKPDHAGDPLCDPLSTGVLVAKDFGLTKSQKWLLASLREAVQDNATHLALLKDMEESWRQARKGAREVLSTKEEDQNLASLKDELQGFLCGRKGPQIRSKGKREHRRLGKTNVG